MDMRLFYNVSIYSKDSINIWDYISNNYRNKINLEGFNIKNVNKMLKKTNFFVVTDGWDFGINQILNPYEYG